MQHRRIVDHLVLRVALGVASESTDVNLIVRVARLWDPERKEPTEFKQEIIENEISVEGPLALRGQLRVKVFEVLRVSQKVVSVVPPFEPHEGSDVGSQLLVQVVAVIEHLDDSQEFVQIFLFFNLVV